MSGWDGWGRGGTDRECGEGCFEGAALELVCGMVTANTAVSPPSETNQPSLARSLLPAALFSVHLSCRIPRRR